MRANKTIMHAALCKCVRIQSFEHMLFFLLSGAVQFKVDRYLKNHNKY